VTVLGDRLHVYIAPGQEEEVQAALAAAGLGEAEMRRVPPSIEDIFVLVSIPTRSTDRVR